MLTDSLRAKQQAVERQMAGCSRVLVAFSGGVDSTLLAVLAQRALGNDQVLAVTADSPSLARADLAAATHTAAQLGLHHLVIQTHEVERPAYQANTPMRCYLCKHELFIELEQLACQRQIPVILYGAIADDQPVERPGQQAAADHGVRAPLQEAGFTKQEIRQLARSLGLPNWDRPQNACLSSRLPHGQPVTREQLARIEQAEAAVRAHGFRQVRVRARGHTASIEVGRDQLEQLTDPAAGAAVMAAVQECGFSTVTLDPLGYRSSGAASDALTE